MAAERIVQIQARCANGDDSSCRSRIFSPGAHVAALIASGSQLSMSGFAGFAYTGAVLWSATFIGIGYEFGARLWSEPIYLRLGEGTRRCHAFAWEANTILAEPITS